MTLERKQRLQRKTKLTSKGSLRSTPSADGVKPRRKTGKHVGESKAKRLAKQRSGGDCEIRSPWCQGRGREFSHRLAEGQGGKWLIVNGLFSCGHGNLDGCHGYCHQNPAEARRFGWIVDFAANPAEVPVRMWHEDRCDWFYLRDDGSVTPAPWPVRDERHPDDLEVPRPDPGLDGAA